MTPSIPPLSFWPFLLFLPVLMFLLSQSKSRSKLNLPPGPRPLPIIGNLPQLIRSGNMHRTLHNLAKLHGPLVHLYLGRIPTLIVSTPSLAEHILKIHDTAFCSRPFLVAFNEYAFNSSDVAASPYGDQWRNMRKIFALNLLSTTKVLSFRSTREEEAERMIQLTKTRADVSSPINITQFAHHLTRNILCRVALGVKGVGEFGESVRLQELFEEAHSLMGSFFVGEFFPGFGWIDKLTGMMRKLKRNARKLDALYQEVIDRHLNEKTKECSEEDIVDVLLGLWRQGQITMDNVKALLMDIFFGGVGTTASAITWTMTELARNPTIMKKAQDEVRSILGSKGRVDELDLPQLHYLKSVLNEALRLHPPGPLLFPRETTQLLQINGYDIGPKTRVFVNVWAMGRDKNIWENPEVFTPERFLGNSIDYKGQYFQFLPFGAGRRICPGMNFATPIVELALANLLYTFNWELPRGMTREDIDMSEAPGIAVEKKIDLCLVATNN